MALLAPLALGAPVLFAPPSDCMEYLLNPFLPVRTCKLLNGHNQNKPIALAQCKLYYSAVGPLEPVSIKNCHQ